MLNGSTGSSNDGAMSSDQIHQVKRSKSVTRSTKQKHWLKMIEKLYTERGGGWGLGGGFCHGEAIKLPFFCLWKRHRFKIIFCQPKLFQIPWYDYEFLYFQKIKIKLSENIFLLFFFSSIIARTESNFWSQLRVNENLVRSTFSQTKNSFSEIIK